MKRRSFKLQSERDGSDRSKCHLHKHAGAAPEGEKRTAEVHLFKSIRWRLTLFVFSIFFLSGLLTFLVAVILISVFRRTPLVIALILQPISLCLVLLFLCMVFGTALSNFFGRYYLHPLKRLIAATKEVRNGNYKVQVQCDSQPHTEMGIFVQSFNEMVRELDSVELFRNDFINNFSHEFKTPMVSIRGFARELQVDDLDESRRQEYVKIILEESDRLTRLATGILELSKLENQQILSEKKSFDLAEQIRQCILLQESQWMQKNLEVIPELDDAVIFSNEELLEHVWSNLISNAVKFTPERGSVYITLRADEQEAIVQIRDTGIGMSDAVKAHIFEKFYQADASRGEKGYGIGLALVQRAVALCGGRIQVESELGKGSTFTVILPTD